MFNIFKLIPRGAVREPMIRKRGHNYYKGTRVGRTGSHTKHGQYIIELERVRKYVMPDLEGFELTPYVSHQTPKITLSCNAADFKYTK